MVKLFTAHTMAVFCQNPLLCPCYLDVLRMELQVSKLDCFGKKITLSLSKQDPKGNINIKKGLLCKVGIIDFSLLFGVKDNELILHY